MKQGFGMMALAWLRQNMFPGFFKSGRIGLFFVLIVMTSVPGLAKEDRVKVTDARGRTVYIKTPVRRIVVLPSDTLEIIRILDAKDRVVGVNDSVCKENREFWPDLSKRPSIGHPFTPNYERIVVLTPDLVLAYSWRPGPELEETLEPLGIQVLRFDFYRMSTLMNEVRELNRLIGDKSRAERYETWYRNCLSVLENGLKTQKKLPRVYMEAYGDYVASGPGSGGFEMGAAAGGDMIVSPFSVEAPLVATEFLVSQDPDVIVKMVSGRGQYSAKEPRLLMDTHARMAQRPGWPSLRPVKNGRLYALSADIGPGPRGIIGVLYMAKAFHPVVFKNFDVEKAHRKYLEGFQGVPYQGTYVYPGAYDETK